MNLEIIVFVLYFVILFGVALFFFFNGSNQNQKDYFLGGRSMGPWVAAMSAQASDMSAWLRWEQRPTGSSAPSGSESFPRRPMTPSPCPST